MDGAPLTVGTAGHIDHGKTELVRALTGVDTDRLPEERRRGITIVLGFAPLRLPSGRLVSLIDVPGHERLVRVMVSGASGIDSYLLVIAADDGVMPQTLEHVRVLEALGVREGMVAITKSDLADPAAAVAQARELRPGAEIVACSARTGAGTAEVAAALERVAARVHPRAPLQSDGAAAVLHVDRAFTVRGAGTVVTGTLWSGAIAPGQSLRLLPARRDVRVRAVQVHGADVASALAGQRVAVNLRGVPRRAVAPGDALISSGAAASSAYRLLASLALEEPLGGGERVQVHHGTRSTPARAIRREDDRWELRAERPLIAAAGDHLVLRRISPPGTLGGGVILATGRAAGRRAHAESGADGDAAAIERARAETPAEALATSTTPPELSPGALALEQRLLAAGAQPLSEADLGEQAGQLAALRAAGRAVRVGRSMYAHPEALDEVRSLVTRLIEDEGSVNLARLRDELQTSRKYAQAHLEHLDAARVTLRRPDDSRVLRRSAANRP
ncbi:MAG: selenocysteine-specific translation elongation factor [Solirubrobacteraceae bacterium]